MDSTADEHFPGARRASEQLAFADWSMETTRRLSRSVLRCGPEASVLDLVQTLAPPGHEPALDTEYETGIHEDMLSVVLAHQFHQALQAESPDLAHELADLSYAEALYIVYAHEHDD